MLKRVIGTRGDGDLRTDFTINLDLVEKHYNISARHIGRCHCRGDPLEILEARETEKFRKLSALPFGIFARRPYIKKVHVKLRGMRPLPTDTSAIFLEKKTRLDLCKRAWNNYVIKLPQSSEKRYSKIQLEQKELSKLVRQSVPLTSPNLLEIVVGC